MRYTVYGFSQEKLIEFGLDQVDATILRYFIDFRDTKKMKTRVIEGECYYWLFYEAIIKEYPILNLKTKDSVYRRLKKLEEAGVLKRVTVRENGVYSFYNVDEKYMELISKNSSDNNPDEGDINQEDTEENMESYGCKVGTNKPSTRSINKINIVEMNLDGIVREIVDYLNLKANKEFRYNTRATVDLIKSRVAEGFKVEDFIGVIDNMVQQWKGTELGKYLVPTTLFGEKFESYLNTDTWKACDNRINQKPVNKPVDIRWGEM